MIKRIYDYYRRKGIKQTIIKIFDKLYKGDEKYNYEYTSEELLKQRKKNLDKKIKISVIVPLYNTPINYLIDMIESLKKQTYLNWELCLIDGSDNNVEEISNICLKYAKEDRRILYKKLIKNMGISENTNVGMDFATGDYLALLDHDDILHSAALYEVVKVVLEKNADMIYTDEAIFSNNIKGCFYGTFKPDFSPDLLRSCNYICHFLVFSRELMNKSGRFSKEFDGSQDHDFVFKLSENAKIIEHIPKVLYYWRAHPDSVAGGIEAKPYTIKAGKNAIISHLKRIKLEGTVKYGKNTSTYKTLYKIIGKPLISILILNVDSIKSLYLCINSILEKTSYINFELLILIDNNIFINKLKINYSFIKFIKVKNNYSEKINQGVNFSKGDYIIIIDSKTKIISNDWIQEMLMFAQRKDIGVVGAKIYDRNNKIKEAGLVIGKDSFITSPYKGYLKKDSGYMCRLSVVSNFSAVSTLCIMFSKEKFMKIKGFDKNFRSNLSLVDFSLRLYKAGYYNVLTPYAELYNFNLDKKSLKDEKIFKIKWKNFIKNGDPYYNNNLPSNL